MGYSKRGNIVIWLVLIAFLFQNCKTFKESISLNEAAIKKSENLFKVTMLTGEELILENIEIDNGIYFGTSIRNGEKERILIEKTKVKSVQEVNVKSSKSFNGIGVILGVLSVALGILMFG